MASGSRWSFTAPQGFVTGALVIAGVFIASCGGGMSNPAVLLLGLAIAILSPILIGMLGGGGNDLMVYGTAHVHQVSPLPSTGATGRCEFELLVNARGIDAIPVRHRDPAVPVRKWPDVGATLPVRVSARNPRQLHILWDEVRTHREIAIENDEYADTEYDLDGGYDPLGDPDGDLDQTAVDQDFDQHDPDQHSSDQHNADQHNPDQHNPDQPDPGRQDLERNDFDQPGTAAQPQPGRASTALTPTAVIPAPTRRRPSPFPRPEQASPDQGQQDRAGSESQHPLTPRVRPSAGTPGAGDQDWERPPVIPTDGPGTPA